MGVTYVELEVANAAQPDAGEKVELLVDSGAVYSVVPGDVLERPGIQPLDEQVFRPADGEGVELRELPLLLSRS